MDEPPFSFIRSGCQPLRHSSMNDGFCVQRLIDMVMSPVMQILQPMHSRMSSIRPSSTFFGRNGSAMDGRAQPIRSSTPLFSCRAITSGLVKRPTPTTGLVVSDLIPRTRSSCAASSLKRDGPEQSSHAPWARSQRSGKSACISMKSRTSELAKPRSPTISSSDRRRVRPIVSPTSSRTSATTSRTNRARFSRLPPYSSIR